MASLSFPCRLKRKTNLIVIPKNLLLFFLNPLVFSLNERVCLFHFVLPPPLSSLCGLLANPYRGRWLADKAARGMTTIGCHCSQSSGVKNSKKGSHLKLCVVRYGQWPFSTIGCPNTANIFCPQHFSMASLTNLRLAQRD